MVLVIASILAAMAAAGVGGLRRRSTFAATSGELAASLRLTRAEAYARGQPTAFVIDTTGGRWWSLELTSALDPDALLDAFDPTNPAGVLSSGSLGSGTTFGPTQGWNQSLPAPLALTPTLSTANPNFPFCSFCRMTGTHVGFGVVRFEPGARTRFTQTLVPNRVVEQFSVSGATGGGGATGTVLITILALTGSIQSFSR